VRPRQRRFCNGSETIAAEHGGFRGFALSTPVAFYAVMARRPRLFIPGAAEHVIQRGNNRRDIFRVASDYHAFLYVLREAAEKYLVDVHAYALMTNHVHLMVTPRSSTALPRTMQAVGRRYVKYFNGQYARSGGLFDGRYRSLAIDTEKYWFTCMRYIELNPVRAGMVASPADYPWTSYHCHALGHRDVLVVTHRLYDALGQSAEERQACWREMCAVPLTDCEIRELREGAGGGRAQKSASGVDLTSAMQP
jgi:putative transposase